MKNKINKYFSGLDFNTKEMLTGASASLALRMFGALAQFLLNVVIAQRYDAEGVGVYSLSVMVATISSTVARWGMDQAALKYIAIVMGNTKQIRAIFRRAFIFVSSMGAVISVLIYLAAPVLALKVFHDENLLQPIRYMALGILPFSLVNLFAECLRAIRKIAWYSFIQGGMVPLLSLLFLISIFLYEDNVIGAVLSYVTACFLVMLVGAYVWSRLVPGPWAKTADSAGEASGNLFATANSMAWITIVSILMGFSEIFILGLFKSTEEVGLYSAALRLAMLMSMIILAFNSILAPKFAALYAEKSFAELQSLARKSIIIMLVAELPFLLGYIVFPEYILLFFGETFTKAASVLQILVLGQLINVGAGPISAMLTMTGFEKNVRMIVIVSSSISVASGLILIPLFGITGAAWTATLGMLNLAVMASVSVRRNLHIKIIF